jgi:NADP-reducing hydrogenase subunit HndB
MPAINSLGALAQLRDELIEKRKQEAARGRVTITVALGTCGIAVGALEVYQALEKEMQGHHLEDIVLAQTGCMGLCSHEPTVEVAIGDEPKVSYGRVTREIARRIVQEHLLDGKIVEGSVINTAPFPTL